MKSHVYVTLLRSTGQKGHQHQVLGSVQWVDRGDLGQYPVRATQIPGPQAMPSTSGASSLREIHDLKRAQMLLLEVP